MTLAVFKAYLSSDFLLWYIPLPDINCACSFKVNYYLWVILENNLKGDSYSYQLLVHLTFLNYHYCSSTRSSGKCECEHKLGTLLTLAIANLP